MLNEQDKKPRIFIESLLSHPVIQKLKLVDDKGIIVSTHTYDVLKIALKKIKRDYLGDMKKASNDINFFVILVGIIIHDTTKATLRLNESNLSHSIVMKKYPEVVEEEADFILKEVEETVGVNIKPEIKDHIKHIVVSHHGRWGRIHPKTIEARIVHEADKYSAMYHRITPIGAKRIVKMMSEGFRKEEIVKMTGYTEGIITDRLRRAKKELRLKTNRDLIKYYQRKGGIPDGDQIFSRRIKETQKLIKKVDNRGFEDLILETEIIDYIASEEVFI
jgi:hypothetical protein